MLVLPRSRSAQKCAGRIGFEPMTMGSSGSPLWPSAMLKRISRGPMISKDSMGESGVAIVGDASVVNRVNVKCTSSMVTSLPSCQRAPSRILNAIQAPSSATAMPSASRP